VHASTRTCGFPPGPFILEEQGLKVNVLNIDVSGNNTAVDQQSVELHRNGQARYCRHDGLQRHPGPATGGYELDMGRAPSLLISAFLMARVSPIRRSLAWWHALPGPEQAGHGPGRRRTAELNTTRGSLPVDSTSTTALHRDQWAFGIIRYHDTARRRLPE
jgi:hypothetical protein